MKIKDFITIGYLSGKNNLKNLFKSFLKSDADYDADVIALSPVDFIISCKNGKEYETWFTSPYYSSSKLLAKTRSESVSSGLSTRLMSETIDGISSGNMYEELKKITKKFLKERENVNE